MSTTASTAAERAEVIAESKAFADARLAYADQLAAERLARTAARQLAKFTPAPAPTKDPG